MKSKRAQERLFAATDWFEELNTDLVYRNGAEEAILLAEQDAEERHTKELEESISRKIVRDQYEGQGWEFVEKMQLKYGRRLEVSTRGILRDNYPSSTLEKDKAILDNILIEMVFDNQLVAMVYYRRNTFNFTEITCVEIGGRKQLLTGGQNDE